MNKVVIAIDSFKGCLSSAAIADAVERGILAVSPDTEVVKIPIADGGEGTVEALVTATQGSFRHLQVCNPLMQPVEATYGILGDGTTAVIEMSAASGLSLIPYHEGQVMYTTTFGTGQLIADALQQGCRNFLLGIGGSATNDAGIGLLQALGFHFRDKHGKEVAPSGTGLGHVASIDIAEARSELSQCCFHLLTDVRNPLYGPQGAAPIFAPQKGATPAQVAYLDAALHHFADIVYQTLGMDINCAGAGAGGGMAGGCLALLPASIEPGIEVIKQLLHFDEQLREADLIFTGEGKVDGQTRQGKVVSGVLDSARRQAIPVIALTGNCEVCDPRLYDDGLTALFPIHPAPVTLETALQPDYAIRELTRTTQQIISALNRIK